MDELIKLEEDALNAFQGASITIAEYIAISAQLETAKAMRELVDFLKQAKAEHDADDGR